MSPPYIRDLFNLPEDVTTIISKRAAIYSQIRANGVPVMLGLMELHAEIGRRQIPWAVATSSPRAHAEEILHQLGLHDRCRAIAAGSEVTHGTPHPEIYSWPPPGWALHPSTAWRWKIPAPAAWPPPAPG